MVIVWNHVNLSESDRVQVSVFRRRSVSTKQRLRPSQGHREEPGKWPKGSTGHIHWIWQIRSKVEVKVGDIFATIHFHFADYITLPVARLQIMLRTKRWNFISIFDKIEIFDLHHIWKKLLTDGFIHVGIIHFKVSKLQCQNHLQWSLSK